MISALLSFVFFLSFFSFVFGAGGGIFEPKLKKKKPHSTFLIEVSSRSRRSRRSRHSCLD